jgi:ribose transport system ATP-binding protein
VSPKTIVALKGVSVQFPGVKALDRVDLDIYNGEIHVLLGENGAGKSTLVKILCGIYKPSEGEIFFSGERYEPKGTLDAIKSGIRVVYQEFNLLPYLSIAENIFFEQLPKKHGFVQYKVLMAKAAELLNEVGLGSISPRTPVEQLGVAQKQLVEICKALSAESKLLILDEPTATLMPEEIENLFSLIRKLKEKGVSVIYISHRLKEVFEIGDRITVLRNGSLVGTHRAGELDIPGIVKMMVGKEMASEYPFDAAVHPGTSFFSVRNLRYRGNQHSVDFDLRRGEILGVAGLVGSGRTETMRALYGADKRDSGSVTLNGRELSVSSPKDAVKNGICLLTEDRKSQGLVLEMSCTENITITNLGDVSSHGLLKKEKEAEVSRSLIKKLGIRTTSERTTVKNLSGGNQQKIVIAKWLYRNAEVLIFDEPTRGIDVGAKYEIYLLLWKLAAEGKGIIVISSDLPEIMGICHRMLIFSNGKITGELKRKEFSQERILSLSYAEYLNQSKETEERRNG